MSSLKPFPYDKLSNGVLECLVRGQHRIENQADDDIQTDKIFSLHRLIIVHIWENGIEIPDIFLDNLLEHRLRALVRTMIIVIYQKFKLASIHKDETKEIPEKLLKFVLKDIEENKNLYPCFSVDDQHDDGINAFEPRESIELCKYLADKGYYAEGLFERLCNNYYVDDYPVNVIYCKLVKQKLPVHISMVPMDLGNLKTMIYSFIIDYKLPFGDYPEDFLKVVSQSDTASSYFIRLLKSASYKKEDIPKEFFKKIGITWDSVRTEQDYWGQEGEEEDDSDY